MSIKCQCEVCGKEFTVKASYYTKHNHFTCSMACKAILQSKLAILRLEEITKQDLKEWLTQKYVVEELTTRQIATILYGRSSNSPNVSHYLRLFNIPIKTGGDAVRIQWKNADKRREQTAQLAREHLCTDANREKLRVIQSTEEYREKSSVAKRGSNNPMWNNDLSDEEREKQREGRRSPEDYFFRTHVLQRDNYTCQKCGAHDATLNAHHILNYKDNPELRYDVNNGITLCTNCHIQFHRQYGYRNNTAEQLLEYVG